MSVDVITSIEIDAAVDRVAGFACDPDNAPTWYKNIKSVEWISGNSLDLGARVAFVASFLGRRLAYTYEVKELEPGRFLVMSTSEGPFPMETSYKFEPLDDNRTRMTLRNRGVPTGFSKIAAPMMTAAMRRANESDLRSIKNILENQAT